MKLTITNTQYKQLPERLQKLFIKMYNHSSEEVRECFPESKWWAFPKTHWSSGFVSPEKKESRIEMNDSGNASRFFKSILYYPKASKSERKLDDGSYSTHPTVKPIALMEYLIKVVTKEWGIVFDPFTWSWTTLVAAKKNWFQYLGTEMTDEYIPIIEARLSATELEEEEIIDKWWFG